MSADPRSILIFRNGSIGNTLAAIPAIRAIRQTFVNSSIALVVDPVGREIFEHCHWINHLIVYDKNGVHQGLTGFLTTVRRLRQQHPTHAVLFKRFFRNGLLARLSGASVRAGFETAGRAPFLNLVLPYDEAIHIVDLNLSLAQMIGAQVDSRALEFFFSDEDLSQAAEIRRKFGVTQPYLICHYGGTTTTPDYVPDQRLAQLITELNDLRLSTVFIGRGKQESDAALRLSTLTNGSIALTDLPLRVSAALIRDAGFYLGFDSGPSHIAAAVGTPGIAIFKPDSNTSRQITKWRPYSDKIEAIAAPSDTESTSEWSAFYKMGKLLYRSLT